MPAARQAEGAVAGERNRRRLDRCCRRKNSGEAERLTLMPLRRAMLDGRYYTWNQFLFDNGDCVRMAALEIMRISNMQIKLNRFGCKGRCGLCPLTVKRCVG